MIILVQMADPSVRVKTRVKVCHLHQYYHSVIIRGQASVVPDGPLKVAALNALVTKQEKGADHELVNEEMPAHRKRWMTIFETLSLQFFGRVYD